VGFNISGMLADTMQLGEALKQATSQEDYKRIKAEWLAAHPKWHEGEAKSSGLFKFGDALLDIGGTALAGFMHPLAGVAWAVARKSEHDKDAEDAAERKKVGLAEFSALPSDSKKKARRNPPPLSPPCSRLCLLPQPQGV
jgi:hypothetical protein